jgi:hypothetical protein
MHLAAVAIVRRLVSLPGGKVEGARNLFIEQNVAHRM